MDTQSWLGSILDGRYILEKKLGQGGMSQVYKANDPNLRRPVAIKLIHPHLADDAAFVRRFEEEVAVVARLSHSNMVQVHDFHQDKGTYYMVLEFINEQTLQERLQELNSQR